jgi:hypothetical protein
MENLVDNIVKKVVEHFGLDNPNKSDWSQHWIVASGHRRDTFHSYSCHLKDEYSEKKNAGDPAFKGRLEVCCEFFADNDDTEEFVRENFELTEEQLEELLPHVYDIIFSRYNYPQNVDEAFDIIVENADWENYELFDSDPDNEEDEDD